MLESQELKIMNFDKIQNLLKQREQLFPKSDIEVRVQDEKPGSKTKTVMSSIDSIKDSIISIAKNFPHRKCVVACVTENAKMIVEVHPWVESA